MSEGKINLAYRQSLNCLNRLNTRFAVFSCRVPCLDAGEIAFPRDPAIGRRKSRPGQEGFRNRSGKSWTRRSLFDAVAVVAVAMGIPETTD